MKTYLKSFLCTGSIQDKRDGTARLVICLSNGEKAKDSVHKNRKAALAAWYRFNA